MDTFADRFNAIAPVAGPSKRPYPKNPLDQNDPNYDPVVDPHNPQYNPNDPRLVGGVSPYVLAHGSPPVAGPQPPQMASVNQPATGNRPSDSQQPTTPINTDTGAP